MSGFTIDGTHTERDLGLCCASRSITAPEPKSVRKSLPYADGALDFSNLGGRHFFETRTLKFVFDVLADSPDELEDAVSRLREFVAFVHDSDIYDDDAPDYHYRGSFDSLDEDPDEYGLSSEVTVSFAVEPYRVANNSSEVSLSVGSNRVVNKGAWCRPTIVPSGTVTVRIGSLEQTYTAPSLADMALERGENIVTVSGGSARLVWNERRL